jgi:predicted RNase H-like nuclease (RuvC/YqgF family)
VSETKSLNELLEKSNFKQIVEQSLSMQANSVLTEILEKAKENEELLERAEDERAKLSEVLGEANELTAKLIKEKDELQDQLRELGNKEKELDEREKAITAREKDAEVNELKYKLGEADKRANELKGLTEIVFSNSPLVIAKAAQTSFSNTSKEVPDNQCGGLRTITENSSETVLPHEK